MAWDELEGKQLAFEHRRKAIEARIDALRAEFRAEEEEFARIAASARWKSEAAAVNQSEMSKSRKSREAHPEGRR